MNAQLVPQSLDTLDTTAGAAAGVARPQVAAARRVVVKLGTRVLMDERGELAQQRVSTLVAAIAGLAAGGREVLLVSSGAVGTGLGSLRLDRRPSWPELKGTCAAVGQGMLMAFYQGAFRRFGVPCGQFLVGQRDLEVRRRALALRQTLDVMLSRGLVPVINENDAVETAATARTPGGGERAFADNDRLAAILAALLGADLLVLLTDVAGLYERDPRRHPEARLLAEVADAAALGRVAAGVGSPAGLGRGGMRSKVEAATIAQKSGCATVIADGAEPGALSHLLAGEALGTFFPAGPRPDALDRWIACAARPHGVLHLDAGAVAALLDGRASLLAAGVTAVDGRFDEGDVVELRGPAGKLVGRALLAMGDARCRELAGAPKVTLVRRQYVVLAEGLPQASGGAA